MGSKGALQLQPVIKKVPEGKWQDPLQGFKVAGEHPGTGGPPRALLERARPLANVVGILRRRPDGGLRRRCRRCPSFRIEELRGSLRHST